MLENRLSIITDEEWMYAFSVYPPNVRIGAHIVPPKTQEGEEEPKLHPRALLFLMALYSCVVQGEWEIVNYEEDEKEGGNKYTLNLRKFAKFMGMDAAAGKSVDIMAALKTLEKFQGVYTLYQIVNKLGNYKQCMDCKYCKPKLTDDKQELVQTLRSKDIFIVKQPENENHCVIFKMPYVDAILDAEYEKETETREPFIHERMSASVCKAKCIPAVYLSMAMLHTLVTRGVTPNGKFKKNKGKRLEDRQQVVSHLKMSTLIRRVQSINIICTSKTDANGKSIANDQNIRLKRIFKAANDILHEQTDIYTYYEDLTISGFEAPRMGRMYDGDMKKVMYFRHYGVNDETEKAVNQSTVDGTAV